MEPFIYISLLSGFGGAVMGFILFYYINKILVSWKMRKRVELSKFSEEEAEALLKKKGFKIIGKQKKADVITYVNGKPKLGYVIADFIVEKNGKKFVAEVKAGETVADPTEPSTRRQLLEYKFAFKPYKTLLVDMIEKTIQLVDFEYPVYGEDRIFRLILISLVVIIALCLLWVFVSIKIL